MTRHVSFSIVIPSHSQPDLLRRCLVAVQNYAPLGTEIVVVDDGSAKGAISAVADEFSSVTTIRNETALGFCRAANRGITASRGEIVELLNDDAEPTAGWAECALERFRNPNVGGVTPLVLQDKPDRSLAIIDTAGDDYDQGGFARKRGHGERYDCEGPFSKPAQVAAISAAAGFYRRSALQKVGAFPELFGAYFDDVDLSLRLSRGGYQLWYEPSSVVWHAVSATFGKRPSKATLRMQSRNEELLYWRNLQGWGHLRWLPRHLAVLAGKAVLRSREGQLTPWLTGRFQAVVMLTKCARIAEK
jgi:GT2 family glycosyltransferase